MTAVFDTSTGALMGIRVNVDGTMEDVRIDAGSGGSHVERLNRAVESRSFDVVGLADRIDVFVDDEGRYTAEHNPVLSAIVRDLARAPLGYRLHGAGVFLGVNDDTGDTLTLTPAQRATVAAAWLTHAPIAAL